MAKLSFAPLAACALVALPAVAHAQAAGPGADTSDTPALPNVPPAPAPYRYEPREAEMRSAWNAVFAEAMGSGGLYSVNFDRMLGEHVAARLGFSYLSFTDKSVAPDASTMITVPLTAAWLPGTANHKLELGAGATMTFLSGPIAVDVLSKFASTSKGASAFGSAILGYRYTPVHGGFFFRAGFTPVFGPGGFWPWGGMSFGGLF